MPLSCRKTCSTTVPLPVRSKQVSESHIDATTHRALLPCNRCTTSHLSLVIWAAIRSDRRNATAPSCPYSEYIGIPQGPLIFS
ncbi:hypothetical protein HBI60_139970 [Parastagonospora nodorum]|nr:hypothetical protein HBH94_208220 [Parastagonospora nodorum]KAH6393781.1 hypothetical protein HBI60_139970 [Parastagonospora nodorum]